MNRAPLSFLGVPLALVQCLTAWGEIDESAAWHPLNPSRVIEVRDEPSTAMGQVTYQRLSRAHELLGQAELEDALSVLDRLGTGGLNDYERAQVFQTYGFIYSQAEDQDKAFDAFEKCIELDALPTQAQQGIMYSLASYYSSEGRYSESNSMIMRWFRHEGQPIPDAYMLLGINHSEQEELLEALPYVRQANVLAESAREPWKQLELALLFETKRYGEAITLLEEMIALWPDKVRYYEMLSGLLVETGEDARALSALMIAWLGGLLTEEHLVLTLVRLNLYLDHPARGGEILEDAIEHGHVQPTFENLELLLNAWANARETDKAVSVISTLAELAQDGDYYLRKALLLNEKGEWQAVAQAAQKAIEKGGLERPGDAWILRGVALAELERFGEAIAAFEGAGREGDQATRRNADSWVAYVRDRSGG